ncbi:GNAT family N-acetyltransferase [Pseudomonas sp. AN3A02]|uniref:GNAT family N-acetyltransferase n=1 Tax=Pseudomonas sp. AN3A02 TaxID=2719587 RepID=UPI00142FF1ED|nr:GNAT family N-acetyltransferase [Pseudomonas sp. AN3A02]NIL14840.1 GNAT family N-acetyltransferase [Pseudomonas sp. AN3A02]
MTSFRVRELSSTDTEALLAFETRNREWFESHIEARAPSFYSVQGVAEHIEGYLSGLAAGAWHPFVIEDASGEIVGRANLKSIDSPTGSAEVGYRVGERSCGQGLATLALNHLIHEAQARWALKQLVAYVYPENMGSQKVLSRCGFVPEQSAPDGMPHSENRFVLSLQA